MGSAGNKWLCVPLLLGALAIAGCVPVPRISPSDEPLAGRRIKPENVAFIKPSMTSRNEVISSLGVPTVDLSDLRILVYVWIDLKEDWGIVRRTPRTADWALLVAIDENNRVARLGIDQRPWSDTVISQARKWAEAEQVSLPPVRTSFDLLPVSEEKGVIYIYRVKPPFSFFQSKSWPAPVAVAIDNQYVTEMRDETYAAVPVSAGRHAIVVDPYPSYRSFGVSLDPSKRRPGTMIVEVSQGQQYFLEVLSAATGGSGINTSLTVRNESDAKPVLQALRPVW